MKKTKLQSIFDYTRCVALSVLCIFCQTASSRADVTLHPLAYEMAYAFTDTSHPSGLIPYWAQGIHFQMLAPDTDQDVSYTAALVSSTVFQYSQLALTRLGNNNSEFSILDRNDDMQTTTNFLVVFYDGADSVIEDNSDYQRLRDNPAFVAFTEHMHNRYQRIQDGCFAGLNADTEGRLGRFLLMINAEYALEDQVKCAKIALPAVFGVAATRIPMKRPGDAESDAFTAFDEINIQMKIKAAAACRIYDKDRTPACARKALRYDYEQIGALSKSPQ